MAEVIHEHEHTSGDGNSGMGFFLGIVVLIIVVIIALYYGLPYLRGSGTSVNVPDKIDVNVNQPAK